MELIIYKLKIVYFSEAEKDDEVFEKTFASYRKAKKAFRAFESENWGVIHHAEISPVFVTEFL